MLTIPYLSELLSAEYRQSRLKEAELECLVKPTFRKSQRSAWRTMVLVVANGLIAAGYHLQAIGREPLITNKV
jgi:hypothetical protein